MPQTIIDLLKKGTEANKTDAFRRDNLVSLPAEGSLIATGDIHGHRRNFERIIAFADLANNSRRHLILQEIIHGGPQDSKGGCLSYKVLFDAVRCKLQFPDRVHIIMSNHDTAFINNSEVMKEGKEMNRSMRLAMEREFAEAGTDIQQALSDFFFSQPLAVRCENRIWLSHSLPGNRYTAKFDEQILNRKLSADDFKKPGSVYLLTWGRKQNQQTLDRMARIFDVDIFVLGHQKRTYACSRAGENLVIVNSEHNHGCLLTIDLTKTYTTGQLLDSAVPLASIS